MERSARHMEQLRRERAREAQIEESMENRARELEREAEERRRQMQEEEDEEMRLQAQANREEEMQEEAPNYDRESVRAAMKYTNKTISPLHPCAICLGEENKRPRELACKHVFHRHCLKKWLKSAMRCPLCNKEI